MASFKGVMSVSRPGRHSGKAVTPSGSGADQSQTKSQSASTPKPEPRHQAQPVQAPAQEKPSVMAVYLPAGDTMSRDGELTTYIDSRFGLMADVVNLCYGYNEAVSPRLAAFLRWACKEVSAQGEPFDNIRQVFFDADNKAFQSLVDLGQYGNASSVHMEYVRVLLTESGDIVTNEDGVVKVEARLSDDELETYKSLHGLK